MSTGDSGSREPAPASEVGAESGRKVWVRPLLRRLPISDAEIDDAPTADGIPGFES